MGWGECWCRSRGICTYGLGPEPVACASGSQAVVVVLEQLIVASGNDPIDPCIHPADVRRLEAQLRDSVGLAC